MALADVLDRQSLPHLLRPLRRGDGALDDGVDGSQC